MCLDNGKHEVFVGDKPDRGIYTVDATSTPKGMTITGTEGPNHGKTNPAIYELTGDGRILTLFLNFRLGRKDPLARTGEPRCPTVAAKPSVVSGGKRG